jgi:hypothetical protein
MLGSWRHEKGYISYTRKSRATEKLMKVDKELNNSGTKVLFNNYRI